MITSKMVFPHPNLTSNFDTYRNVGDIFEHIYVDIYMFFIRIKYEEH